MGDHLEHPNFCLWDLAIVLPLTVSFGIALIIGCLTLVAGIAHFVFAFQTSSVDGFSLANIGEHALWSSCDLPCW